MMYYETTQDPVFSVLGSGGEVFGRPSSEFNVSDIMPFIGGGATLFVNRFFVDAYVQRAFSGDDQSTFDTLLFDAPDVGDIVTRQQLEDEWERDEYSISAGYAVTDNFSLFAGYRHAETEFDEKGSVTGFPLGENVPIGPDIPINRTLNFENDGPFVGGRYGWRIGDLGIVGLNLGIALVDGEFTEQNVPTTKGDTLGTTVGLSWTAPLPAFEGFNYLISIDGYQYSFEADDPPGVDLPDFSENVVRASAGVSYLF
jgi:hypothetical protein